MQTKAVQNPRLFLSILLNFCPSILSERFFTWGGGEQNFSVECLRAGGAKVLQLFT